MAFPFGQGTCGEVSPHVLVVTYALDPTADFVLRELNARGVPFWRTDLADFPTRTTLSAELRPGGGWAGSWSGEARGVDLSEVRAVWWRKPTRHEFAGTMSGPEQQFASVQAKQAMTVLSALPDVLWVNRPQANADCTKPVQLAAAAASGLNVPETLITNVPSDVAEFAKSCGGRIITKVLGGIVHTEGGKRGQLYTRRVPAEQWSDPRIALTAHLFQQEITDKAYEIRVTVVDDQLFPVAIHAPAGPARLDWRQDSSSLGYSTAVLPGYVQDGIREMMRRLGLVYAALDFIVDSKGVHHLVDVNPGGQWAWIDRTRDAITHALADLLQKGHST
ncbi:MvdC/MvdD family ATP grasp protein [Streptomyces sp. NPDC048387]|uniref:MvdC/MvdD family ATP grasp protein n=1 Tax=Streptomyces sp. NPDC048387 TaxID=3365542 RepID=UPI00371DCD6C